MKYFTKIIKLFSEILKLPQIFNILSIISSLGVGKFITKSTFLLFSAKILSKASAWAIVLGKPSKINPFLQLIYPILYHLSYSYYLLKIKKQKKDNTIKE